ncbi:MAG: YfhO family protein [Gemmatimonadales bacterium]
MSHPDVPDSSVFTPRWPFLTALAVFVVAMLSLCWPMLAGKFLVGPMSDQFSAGYGFRLFGAEFFREHGRIPEWNPYLFGGMPFIAAMHGDIFYPTAWLRWILPVDTAMNLGFALHFVLAGAALYLLLRALGSSWTAALVGGLAYELTGILASLVKPGHDGKLFVSALAPLLFLGLLRAVRDGKPWGYGMVALVTGLALISPHYQLTYYLLVAAGFWTLYLVFAATERPAGSARLVALAGSLAAVLLGLAISAIQALPFLSYLPYAARGTNQGWEYATAFALPVEELMTTVLPQFNGILEQYWGQNFFKLHTEYVGALVLVLAILGLGDRVRGSLRWILAGIAGFFLLVAFGGHTPFYRLWYEVMPLMKKVRAPGMAFFLPAMVTSMFAAFGVDRLLRGDVTRRALLIPLALFGGVAVLGAVGVLQAVAEALAKPEQMNAVVNNAGALQGGAIRLLLVLLAGGAAIWAVWAGRVRGRAAAGLLAIVVVADLWSVDRQFFDFSAPARELYADDAVIAKLRETKPPFRVFDVPGRGGVYDGSWLMAHRVQGVFGYHGNEVRFYDELWGGKNQWTNLASPNLWNLFAVRFLLLREPQQLPGFHAVGGPMTTTAGAPAHLYERDTVPAYARVIGAAAKVPEAQAVPTIIDQRFPIDNVVVFADTASVQPAALPGGALPPKPAVKASVVEWEPGRMRITLDGTAPATTYLLVSETWYPDWHATVDGKPTPVHRADFAAIGVELPAGAKEVALAFASPAYRTGKLVTLIATVLTLGLLASPLWWRRSSDHA